MTSSSTSVNCRRHSKRAPLPVVHATSLAFAGVRFAQENFWGGNVLLFAIDASAGLPMGDFRGAFAKNDGGDTATAPPDASMPLLPASAGFLNRPSAATAASLSSRRTRESGQIGRRRRDASSNCDPVSHAPPTIDNTGVDGLMAPRKFHLRSRRQSARAPHKPKSATREHGKNQRASSASRQEQLRWQFRST
jgi:hypothetical protein